MIADLYTQLAIGILLGSSAQTVRELVGTRRFSWLPIVFFGLTFVPIMGFNLGRWIFTFTGPISVPLALMLGWHTIKPCISSKPINNRCLLTFWCMTLSLAVAYFPMAIGWTSFDPHSFGWSKQFIFVPIAAAIICMWLGQGGLSIVFAATALAWKLGLLQSSNGWNYLVDPVAICVCAFSLASYIFKAALQRKHPSVCEQDLSSSSISNPKSLAA